MTMTSPDKSQPPSTSISNTIMRLDQLPTEVLHLIFSSFWRNGSTTLYHLSLTNRIISQIARPLIPSCIHLHPLQPEVDNDIHAFPNCFSHAAKQSLLRRTIDENPAFGHGVVFLSICFRIPWNCLPIVSTQEKEGFIKLLKGFPKVKYLDMNCGRLNQASLLVENLGMRDTLEEINMWTMGISPSHLANLSSLPNLRHLSVEGALFGRWTENDDLPAQHNNLKSLSMNFGIKLPALREILRYSNRLKRLEISAPLDSIWQPDIRIHGKVPQEVRKRLEPFFAAAIGNVLAIIRTTLEHLCLDGRRAAWPGSDGTRLDLSGFPALKLLSLTAWCFLEPLTTGKARDGFFKLLPPSLEELHITFQTEVGIFYEVIGDQLEAEGRRNFTDNSIEAHKIVWILQLAEEKKDHFPLLKLVELREELDPKGRRLFQVEKWEVPEDLESRFKMEGIDLSVHVRVQEQLQAARRASAQDRFRRSR